MATTFADIPLAEGLALIDLYNDTDGDNWTNGAEGSGADGWVTSGENITAGDFYGITVAGGHVTVIDLHSNALNGAMPDLTDIDSMTGNCYFYTNANLTGDIAGLPLGATNYVFSGTDVSGDVADLPTGGTRYDFNGTSVSGAIADIPTGGSIYEFNETSVTGDISDLPSGGSGYFFNTTAITGDIADLPAGGTNYDFSTSAVSGDVADLPAGGSIYYFYATSVSGSVGDLPAGGSYYWFNDTSVTAGSIGHLTTARSIRFNDNGWTTANVDSVINSMYTARATYTYATPALLIQTNAAPTGVYQYAAVPDTPAEKIYCLVNDDDAEGFNTWAVTYDNKPAIGTGTTTDIAGKQATMNLPVSVPDGGNLTVTFKNAANDNVIDSQVIAGEGTASKDWTSLSKSTAYGWYATVDDGAVIETSATYNFNTTAYQFMDIPGAQSLALEALFTDTTGGAWTDKTGWSGRLAGSAFGVTVAGGVITAMDLHTNALNGTIPDLTAITTLTGNCYFYTNANLLGDVADLPLGAADYSCYTTGLSGDVADLPTGAGTYHFAATSITGVVSDLPTGASVYTFYTTAISGSVAGLPAGGTLYHFFDTSVTAGSVAHITTLQRLWVYDNAWTTANIKTLIDGIYAARATFTHGGGIALNISGTNAAPFGVDQYDATPDTTAEEIYTLENDDDAEGFNLWSVTYTSQGTYDADTVRPADGVTRAIASTMRLQATVSVPDGGALEVKFYDGDDNLLGTDIGVVGEGVAYCDWAGRAIDTVYPDWYFTVDDSITVVTSGTQTFTTRATAFTFFSYEVGTVRVLPTSYVLKVLGADFHYLDDWKTERVDGKDLATAVDGELLGLPVGMTHAEDFSASAAGFEINPAADSAAYWAGIISENPTAKSTLNITNNHAPVIATVGVGIYKYSKLIDVQVGFSSTATFSAAVGSAFLMMIKANNPAQFIGCLTGDVSTPNCGVDAVVVGYAPMGVNGGDSATLCVVDKSASWDLGAAIGFVGFYQFAAGAYTGSSLNNCVATGCTIGYMVFNCDMTRINCCAQNNTYDTYDALGGSFINTTCADSQGLTFAADGYTLTKGDNGGTALTFTDDFYGALMQVWPRAANFISAWPADQINTSPFWSPWGSPWNSPFTKL